MSKLLAAIVAAMFSVATVGAFAAAHTGAQPMKDAKKLTAAECKDPKNKDHADCKPAPKKDEMKK